MKSGKGVAVGVSGVNRWLISTAAPFCCGKRRRKKLFKIERVNKNQGKMLVKVILYL